MKTTVKESIQFYCYADKIMYFHVTTKMVTKEKYVIWMIQKIKIQCNHDLKNDSHFIEIGEWR